mmetsp:Transcript_56732/g.91848  ORF Transcript_56732/g.91848 Transcript_56732/m.91848 type:complete len:292 (-) Transcript_56732:530-1405(-)
MASLAMAKEASLIGLRVSLLPFPCSAMKRCEASAQSMPSELNSRMRACMCSAVSHSSHSAIHASCRCVRQDSSTMSGFTWRVSHMHCIRIFDTSVALANKSLNFVHICGSEFKTPENGIRSARSVKPRASLVRTVCSTPPASSRSRSDSASPALLLLLPNILAAVTATVALPVAGGGTLGVRCSILLPPFDSGSLLLCFRAAIDGDSLGARPFLATLFTTPPDELAQLLENSSATTLSLAPGGGTLMKPFTPPGDLISRISRAPMTPSRDFPTNVSCAPFSLQRTLSRELV